jgi:hypothetical protein
MAWIPLVVTVTEDAISISNNSTENHIEQVGTCTIVIAFLRIPHFGTGYASWAELGTKIAKLVKLRTKTTFLFCNRNRRCWPRPRRDFKHIEVESGKKTEIAITCFSEELAVSMVGQVLYHLPSLVYSSLLIG